MPRKLPALTPENRPFWTGGGRGELLIHRCEDCTRWFHPPAPVCPNCRSRAVGPQPVSGRGHVHSFTINVQKWAEDLAVPYIVAIVDLVEQDGLRFLTNIVDCAPDEVSIEDPVEVTFLNFEDVWIPVFRKRAA
ncbi:MAG: Zn-ribbon domain-containing OB-fold protein [Allosphingosinicella sp.]|uniref:Zn-ribbon domain-containing OB-fold protein n=1 Tax=Allosphingosinicella sp. TaxID=2823234 RepID=UPI00394F5382